MDRNRRNARALLASIASELATSRTVKIVCPFCGGGSSQESSLALTLLDSGAAYKCHRAGCGEAGRVGGPILDSPVRPVTKFQPRPLYVPYRPLRPSDRWTYYYELMVGSSTLDPTYAGVHVLEDDPGALVTVCRALDGEILGHQTRRGWPGQGGKEVRTYKMRDRPFYATVDTPNATNEDRPIVVVEDFLSACCAAACGYHGLALIGTYMPAGLAHEIADYQRNVRQWAPILIALDPGAQEQARKVAETMRSAAQSEVRLAYLEDDLKNLPQARQLEILANYLPQNEHGDFI